MPLLLCFNDALPMKLTNYHMLVNIAFTHLQKTSSVEKCEPEIIQFASKSTPRTRRPPMTTGRLKKMASDVIVAHYTLAVTPDQKTSHSAQW